MFKHIYYPILTQIGPIRIFTFGFFVAIGVITAILLASKYAKKKNIPPEKIQTLSLFIIIGGILSSRLIHIIQSQEIPITDFFMIWDGGLSWFGGVLGGSLFAYIYIKHQKLKFLELTDIYSIPIILGLLIGRLGCFFGDGGHVGRLTNVPWGVLIDGEIRHWTVLYSFVLLIPMLLILLKLKTNRRFTGFLTASTMIMYGFGRFIIDIFRIDPRFFSLTVAQYGSIIIFILGVYILYNGRNKTANNS